METALVFLPLFGAIIAGFWGRTLGDKGAQFVTTTALVVSCLLAWIVFFRVVGGGLSYTHVLGSWISVDSFSLQWSLKIDTLTAVMLVVVTTVSALVHVYSVGYMAHDLSIPRFMAYLSFFTFAMLMLVTSDNLVQMFFGWEGVGVASYLLIGFWYTKPSANAAAIKAFLVNRVGDVGFALGIISLFWLTGSVQFSHVFPLLPSLKGATFVFLGAHLPALTVTALLLFIGAMGKSAQLGLHTWLPDAMEGPTPVSALIHAATMVTAGVFMLVRLSPLFELSQVALDVVTVVGASTAFFAATVALTQTDIKRVIAYSTCSQLGYMFFAVGVSAYPAAMFHLMTHAFFKALLFLGAGSVIHAMSDEQDMRRMGGLYKLIPTTYVLMWIGSLSLAGIGLPGVFGFSGFYSKDSLLEAAFAAHTSVGTYAYVMGVAAAFMTAFYSGRLMFMTFHGPSRSHETVLARVHESPFVMLLPLFLLAFGAVFAGFLGEHAFLSAAGSFWNGSVAILPSHHAFFQLDKVPGWAKSLPLVCGLAGLLLSWWMYIARPHMAETMASKVKPLYLFSLHKWYFDELYDYLFVKPALWLGRVLWRGVDQGTLDYLGPDGVSSRIKEVARVVSFAQSGYLYHYAFIMVIGLVVVLAWTLLPLVDFFVNFAP